MRWLATLLTLGLALLWAQAAAAASATSVGSSANTAATSAATTTTGDIPPGDMSVVLAALPASSAWSVTDSAGNSYSSASVCTFNTVDHLVMLFSNVTTDLPSGGTVTLHWTGSTQSNISVVDVKGAATSSPLDVTSTCATGTSTSAATIPTTPVLGTLSQANEIVIGAVVPVGTITSYSSQAPFTDIANLSNVPVSLASGYNLTASTTPPTFGPKWTNGRIYGAMAWSFLESGGAVSGGSGLLLRGVNDPDDAPLVRDPLVYHPYSDAFRPLMASIHGSRAFVPPSSTCPNGTADPNDGCSGANANSAIQFANFFSSVAPQSGQSYFSANPNGDAAIVGTPYNLPGIGSGGGYPVGPYTLRSGANDPQAAAISLASATITGSTLSVPSAPTLNFGQAITGTSVVAGTRIVANLTSTTWQVTGSQNVGPETMTARNRPAACVLTDPSGSYTDYGLLTCDGSTYDGYVWENIDFGAVNGHGPTFLFAGMGAGTFTIQDWWATNAVGGASGVCAQPAATDRSFLYSEATTTGNFVIKWGQVDGNDPTCRFTHMIGINLNTSGYASVEYNYAHNMEGGAINYNVGNTTQSDIQYNVFHNMCFGEWQSHCEIQNTAGLNTSTYPTIRVCYNTSWNDIGSVSATWTSIWHFGGVNNFDVTALTVCNNATITNPISGTTALGNTATISYQVGNSSSGGLGTGPGYYMTVTALSAGAFVMPGMSINMDYPTSKTVGVGPVICVSGCTTDAKTNLPKGGVGSVWTLACSVAIPSGAPCAQVNLDGSGNPGCVTSCYSIYLADYQVTETSEQFSDLMVVFGPAMEVAHVGYNTLAFTGNLFDLTGVGAGALEAIDYVNGPPWGAGSGNGGCATPATLSGNSNLIGGGSLNSWTVTSGNC